MDVLLRSFPREYVLTCDTSSVLVVLTAAHLIPEGVWEASRFRCHRHLPVEICVSKSLSSDLFLLVLSFLFLCECHEFLTSSMCMRGSERQC